MIALHEHTENTGKFSEFLEDMTLYTYECEACNDVYHSSKYKGHRYVDV